MKKKFSGITIICVLIATYAHAEPPTGSLFFTDDEAQKVEQLNAKTARGAANANDIHLGAVMYYGPENWAVWLQGTRWTPETTRADLHITSVEPGAVHLNWQSDPNAAAQDITLRPYQTFQIATGKIVEGTR